MKPKLINRAKLYSSSSFGGMTVNNPEKYKDFRAGQDSAIELLEHEMHLNMQYYMEYCQKNDYITPQDWIKNHKHF